MMGLLRAAAVAAGACVALTAQASETLSEKHGCDNCHAVDKKLVGPAFKAVADRYRGQADAETRLQAKVLRGGTGSWGAVPMPAMAHVPDTDVQTLVAWILAR